ncbi:hypothetical protein FSP39_000290 [Pinctada imbricata]|uniref:Uncharacterized protein n=1 Tax=Pinctada imbricata TaxID=66713 RepID=A0AA89BQ27_PINIB|nr:hypothetical protein FSP39_000290 [Pinctada imbricata]
MWYVTSNEANVEEFSFTRIPVFVNDSYWHEIRIHQQENILNLTLNSPNCKNSPADTCVRQLNYLPGSPNTKVYFGNVENEFVALNTFSQTRFKGCMEDITVNSNILLPTSTGSDAMAIAVTNGCNRRPQCSADTCNTHGKCYDFWDEFRCDCQRPYIGGSCEEEWKPATFAKDNSISEVRFNISSLQADLRSRVDLSLFIRTREEKGLAVYLGDSGSAINGTFLTVEIFDGYLASRLVLCNTKWYLWANNTKINDGNKHLVGVVLQNNVHKLLYNNQVVQEKIIQSNANCPFVGQACYFGGEVPASLRQPGRKRRSTTIVIDNLEDLTNVSRYKGTIQDAQLNNNPMPFFPTPQNVSAPSTNVSVEAVSGLVEGEQSDDVCNNTMPCMNNASCTNEFFNDFSCDCPRGYRGKNCSELDFCHNNSCPASATCQSLNDGFECISTANFGVQSSLSFSPNISSGTKIDKISMMIRTIVKNGHLFAISNGNQYIHVQIEGGMVMMECRLDQGVVQTATVDMNIADKRWHKIELTEYQSNITLMVTGPFENKSSLVDRNSNMATFRSLVDKTSEISLGRKSSIFSYHYFKGCIKEPRIGGILLPFYLQSEFTNFTTQEYFEATMISQIAHNCVEGSECGSNQCRHSSTCKPDYYGYTCDCTGTGYEGFWCQNNINDCQPDSCYNNGVCLDVANGFRCKCPKPYYGYFTRCQNVTDVCSPDPCQNGATCSPVGGDYSCDCTDTFTGQNCTVQKTGCSPNPCRNNGTCNPGQTQANFTCTCPSPYTGPLCDVILDPCNSLPCNNGNCTPGADPGSYNCVCATDYTGLHCETYIDHCNSSPCKNNGSCVDYVGGYNCNCTNSWTGSMCEIDFNECLTQPCQNNGTCQDFTGYYNCDCTGTGYQGILDCATDFDECTLSPCANGGTCYNYDGGYNCSCSLGYTGEHCTVVNCSVVNCNQGQCGLTPNRSQWQCNCNQYYYGKFCNVPGKCASSPCNPSNSLVCTDIDITNQTYICSCKSGWEGQNCEVDIDECTRINPCRNGATCNNTQGSYVCHCAPGYTGTNCGTNIDECFSQPCRNRGQCIDQINKFECNCSGTGYQGSTCMDDINECLGSPCLNEGKCVNTNGSYDCDCVPGYIGPTCAVADPSFQKIGEDDNMLWIIVGPVVAGVLLIIVIIIIVFLMMARNKRATRGTYNPSRQEVIGSRVELGNVMKPPPEERLI